MALPFTATFLTALLDMHVMLGAMFVCSTCTAVNLTVPQFCAATFNFK